MAMAPWPARAGNAAPDAAEWLAVTVDGRVLREQWDAAVDDAADVVRRLYKLAEQRDDDLMAGYLKQSLGRLLMLRISVNARRTRPGKRATGLMHEEPPGLDREPYVEAGDAIAGIVRLYRRWPRRDRLGLVEGVPARLADLAGRPDAIHHRPRPRLAARRPVRPHRLQVRRPLLPRQAAPDQRAHGAGPAFGSQVPHPHPVVGPDRERPTVGSQRDAARPVQPELDRLAKLRPGIGVEQPHLAGGVAGYEESAVPAERELRDLTRRLWQRRPHRFQRPGPVEAEPAVRPGGRDETVRGDGRSDDVRSAHPWPVDHRVGAGHVVRREVALVLDQDDETAVPRQ